MNPVAFRTVGVPGFALSGPVTPGAHAGLMGRHLDRDGIAAAIRRDPVPSVRDIATEFDCSTSTVKRVANAYGLSDRWEHRRAQTENATATRAAQVAEKRQQLESDALNAAAEILARRFDRKETAVKGMEGAEIVTLAAGAEDYKNIGQAVSSLASSSVQLARLESELSSAGQASGLLEEFTANLREARERREQQATEAE